MNAVNLSSLKVLETAVFRLDFHICKIAGVNDPSGDYKRSAALLQYKSHSFSLVLSRYIGSVRKLPAISSSANTSTNTLRQTGVA